MKMKKGSLFYSGEELYDGLGPKSIKKSVFQN